MTGSLTALPTPPEDPALMNASPQPSRHREPRQRPFSAVHIVRHTAPASRPSGRSAVQCRVVTKAVVIRSTQAVLVM
jgi:hypothetical protein